MELKIEARNVELRKGWQTKIEEEKNKVIRHYAGIVLHLRVCIEATSHHKEGGFEIKVVATIPNDTVVVARKGEAVRALLTEAFDVLALQLKEKARKKRKNIKTPAAADVDKVGIIRKLSPFESYGFITSVDNRDIYFHENALKNVNMEELTEGDSVFYGETVGDKGPQASWVRSAN
ncbi:cold shock domain-containing protein [Desulfopila sp. IMCC35008]|uniref:cold shock domain-containing protein n=1 Tax=Desulfopila sp. IMCC35008 TaxID=2653858 RepID=UPI0013D14AF3|nr:cold shock domain-containing protein [Desulfopila sp. IMCC35008]